MENQMGCMTGILQIFDRHQILSGKSTKRLLPPPVVDTVSESEINSEASPVHARWPGKQKQQVRPSPQRLKQLFHPAELPLKLPMSESKEAAKGAASSWKLSKEIPRLSLDSRATTGVLHPKEMFSSTAVQPPSNAVAIDAQVYRSHNLVAKLMGLEPMPNSLNPPESEKKPELRRSSSESGVSRGFLHSCFSTESNNFPVKQKNQSHTPIVTHEVMSNVAMKNSWKNDEHGVNLSPWKTPQRGKSFFDSADHFPEQKQNASAQGEIENRLKMRGREEHANDLETLKNILEALQLKGLLHSCHQKFVYDESPIVVMKPSRSSITWPIHRRTGNKYPPANGRSPEQQFRRNYSVPVENSPPPIQQRARRPNSLVKPKPLSVETRRRANGLTDNRRVLPALKPKLHTRITWSDPMTHTRPPRNKKTTGKDYQKARDSGEDESTSISGSTSTTDTERSRTDGSNLLERCDKLLHSIAEMTAAADMQPSPVSVLDSSLYRDDSFNASSITAKRKIHFKDHHYGNAEEETWSTGVSTISQETSESSDILYISDIISASNLFPGESDLFLFLEKQQFQKGHDSSKASMLQRKATFDTITEILKWIRRLPPWKNVSWTTDDDVTSPSLDKVWLEFQRIRDRCDAEDIYDIVCGVLKKDFARDEITGWKDFPMEMSETILDLERLIFKDLIGEALRDLAALASENRLSRMRRKKVLWK